MAGTSRSSPPPTAGRCGPRRCARAASTTPLPPAPTPELLTQIRAWVDDGRLGLADLGYEGEAETLQIPIKKTAGSDLSCDQQTYNAVHGALRALGERANSLLKTTFKALRRWRGCPWRIGDIVAAALVVLHHEHHRTT
jgi:hypothetical protein